MKNLFFIFCIMLPFFCKAQCENFDFTYSESGDTIFLYSQLTDSTISGDIYWSSEDGYIGRGGNQKFVTTSGEITVKMFYFINPDTCIVSKTFYHEGAPIVNCGMKPFSYSIQDFKASFVYNNSQEERESWQVKWDFGDGSIASGFTSSHTYAAAGSYEVTMYYYANDSCSLSQQITIDAEQPDSSNRYINGAVYSEHSVTGTVISLYKYGYENGAIDFYRQITLTDTNAFIFNSLPTGYYLLQYMPSPSSELFHLVEPTFYYFATTWQDAIIIPLINSKKNLALRYNLVEEVEIPDSYWFTGNDTISGSIFEANPGQRVLAIEGFEHALVTLYNEEGQKLAAMFTREDGSYEFAGLPAGEYTLKISYPGNGIVEEIIVDVDGDGTTKEVVPDFFLAKGSVITSVKDQELPFYNIYPNPARDVIQVKGVKGNVLLEVMDLKGEKVKEFAGNADTEFSVADLKSGIYVIRIIQDDQVILRKMVKE